MIPFREKTALDNIPVELQALVQWVVWKLEPRKDAKPGDKPTKVPYTVGDRHASSTDPRTWMRFDQARALVETGKYTGVGFVFTKAAGIVGIDLDACYRDDGYHPADWAEALVDEFDSYTEVSQSGTGLHILTRGAIPAAVHRNGVEMYDTGRYFALTGNLYQRPRSLAARPDVLARVYTGFSTQQPIAPVVAPSPVAASTIPDADLLARFRQAHPKRYHKLMQAGAAPGDDASGLDYDLACALSEYTRDPAQIARLMQRAPLNRTKWNERRPQGSYLEITIADALSRVTSERGVIKVRPFDQIEREEVTWLWPQVIPAGMLTLFVGDPGHGKSYLTLDLAARLSAGRPMPDGSKVEATDVLLVFCEDGAGVTVKPRLELAGADQARVGELTVQATTGERLLNLETDLVAIEQEIVTRGARLVVLDPLSAYLGDKVNAWRDDSIRRLLGPLAKMAARTGCAIVGILHLNRRATQNVLAKITGSGAFGAVARSVVLVGAHPEDEDLPPAQQRQVFAPSKMNLAPLASGRVYRITDHGIAWEGETAVTGRDMMLADLGVPDEGKRAQAVVFLQKELAVGPRRAAELIDRGRTLGLSPETLRRAKKALGVESKQQPTGGWVWELPTEDAEIARTLAANEPQMVT